MNYKEKYLKYKSKYLKLSLLNQVGGVLSNLPNPDLTINTIILNKIKEFIKRFDSLDLDINNYNILISDTQGYEINVFMGFGNKLNNIDGIIVEYIDSQLYENDSSLESINNYLKSYNFILKEKTIDGEGWGNALFIKIN